jgi:hypothetical protein
MALAQYVKHKDHIADDEGVSMSVSVRFSLSVRNLLWLLYSDSITGFILFLARSCAYYSQHPHGSIGYFFSLSQLFEQESVQRPQTNNSFFLFLRIFLCFFIIIIFSFT